MWIAFNGILLLKQYFYFNSMNFYEFTEINFERVNKSVYIFCLNVAFDFVGKYGNIICYKLA